MRTYFAAAFVASACIVLLTGCPPEPELTLSGEDPGLFGTWEGAVTILGGSERSVTVIFTADEFNITEVVEGSSPRVMQGIYAVDQTSTPKKIDLGVIKTSTNISDLRKEVLLGVYERVEDSLAMSFVISPCLNRPLNIEGGERIYTLTRPTSAEVEDEEG
ncbi:MAG: hypothetical protein U9Q79_07755 [Candidatus Hydrogenedentes bacterium]|nr:hypothetical protein [Candidatus Hydrogenedentota bacterium]